MPGTVITNCRLVTPLGRQALHGRQMSRLLQVDDATVIADDDGIITYAGPTAAAPPCSTPAIDMQGRVVMPGFVDSHTHLIFDGFRADEFKMRLEGATYMQIMNAGGGIQSTVDATRRATPDQLKENALKLLQCMARIGVTTVEAKSGYGLDVDTEMKMLRVISDLNADSRNTVSIVPTMMAAHAIPREFHGDADAYVDHIIARMLRPMRPLACNCDVFTERGVFEIDTSRRLMSAARSMGYNLKFHADEIVTLGGAELAVEMGALSADHLLHVSDSGIEMLASSNTVATLLPLTAFSLKEQYAPARRLIDAGAAVALATDLNPGSCFSGSIPLTISLACIYMGMTIEETITALTLNGAAALGMADQIGSLEPGKRADIIALDTDNINMLPYYVGINLVTNTFSTKQTICHSPNCQ